MANDFTARVAGISVELGMSVQNKSGIWCKPTVKMDLKIDGGTNPQQREAIIKQAFDEVCDNIEKTISEMGNWTRANAELCLLGVRGKPKRMDAGVHSVIMSHIEEHSKKPAETRDRIVKLMAGEGLPKIELFARQCIDGWDCWGNEV